MENPGVSFVPTSIQMHPLVMLSVVDHYSRINSRVSSNRRVVGILIGNPKREGDEVSLDVTQCFAVPFDEDPRDPSVWFLDINFADEMYRMFRKVWSKAKVLGWYSSGPTIQPNDMQIHHFIRQHLCPNPIYVIIDTDIAHRGTPVLAYVAVERTVGQAEFCNMPTELAALEAEEIGIEHLLRDLTDSTISTLSTKIGDRQNAVGVLEQKLGQIEAYLNDVISGALPVDHDIMGHLQHLVNILPQLHQIKTSPAMLQHANDTELCNFVASLGRCVMAIYEVLLDRRRHAKEVKALKEKWDKEKADKEKAEQEKKDKDAAASKPPAAAPSS